MSKKKKNNMSVNPDMNTLDPESKLAILRAKQLVGNVDPVLYEETRQEVIQGLHPKTKEFWEFLENTYDCEVCELEFVGKGTYGFKIRTPKGSFLDYATKKEIIKGMDSLNIKYPVSPTKNILN